MALPFSFEPFKVWGEVRHVGKTYSGTGIDILM